MSGDKFKAAACLGAVLQMVRTLPKSQAIWTRLYSVGVVLRWFLTGVAAALFAVGAMDARADELYTAAKLRTAECVALQLKDSHGGRRLGDVVAFEADGQPVRGVVRAFRCEHGYTGRDAVLIERTDDPFQPWAYTRALESVK